MESEQNSNQHKVEHQNSEESGPQNTSWRVLFTVGGLLLVLVGGGLIYVVSDLGEQNQQVSQTETNSPSEEKKNADKDRNKNTSNTQEERDSPEKDISDQKEESTQDSDSEASTKATIYVKEGDSWIPAEGADDETSGDDNRTNGVSPKEANITGHISVGGKYISALGEEKVSFDDSVLQVYKSATSPVADTKIAYSVPDSTVHTFPIGQGKNRAKSTSAQELHIGTKTKKSDNSLYSPFSSIEEGPGNIAKWGWIPNTDLIWYIPQTVEPSYGRIRRADTGNLNIYNVQNNEIVSDVQVKNIGRPLMWRFDGEKLLYGSVNKVKIFNRQTRTTNIAFKFLGGGVEKGGGGILHPSLKWSKNNSTIYAVAEPLSRHDNYRLVKSQEYNVDPETLRLFKYSISQKELTPLTDSINGTSPFLINEKQNNLVYTKEGGLYLHDWQQNTEQTLVEQKKMDESVSIQNIWLSKDSVYYLTRNGDNDRYTMNKVNTQSKNRTTVFSHIFPRNLNNMRFLPQSEVLFFTSKFNKRSGKEDNSTLYRMEENGVFQLTDKVPTRFNGHEGNVHYNLKE